MFHQMDDFKAGIENIAKSVTVCQEPEHGGNYNG